MTAEIDTDLWFDNEHPALRRCWHPVATSEQLADGGPISTELLGEHWCVVRLGGQLTAFPDACPHRMSPLSAGRIVDDTLQCAYHGYRFAVDGRCVEIPAIEPGKRIPARAGCSAAAGLTESDGLIWLAPDDPVVPLPEVPEHDDPSFVNCPLPVQAWNATAAQMSDNFLDLGHLPFLHAATFGEEDDKVVSDYSLDRDGWRFQVRHRHVTHALADSLEGTAEHRTVDRENFFTFTAPHHVHLRITYFEEDAVLSIRFAHQPVNATTTRLYCTDYRNDIKDTEKARDETTAFQLAVAAEDRALLERMHRKAVPLDPKIEYHSRADRITLEMRRMLSDLTGALDRR